MNCPKCASAFEKISFGGIEVDRCPGCKGLWFDMLEKDDLVRIEGSEEIDIGDDQIGAEYSNLRKIRCPQCSVKMLSMVDKDQVHIQYESCPICYGTFFDAGEFRDLKQHTVLERFMQMLQTLRTNL